MYIDISYLFTYLLIYIHIHIYRHTSANVDISLYFGLRQTSGERWRKGKKSTHEPGNIRMSKETNEPETKPTNEVMNEG